MTCINFFNFVHDPIHADSTERRHIGDDRIHQSAQQDSVSDRRIQNCLDHLGFQTNRLCAEDWQQKRAVAAPISLFYCDLNDIGCKQFQSVFADYLLKFPKSVNLCLLKSASALENARYLKGFDDFLYWPCSVNELAMRLEKFAEEPTLTINNTSILFEKELAEKFTQLNLCGHSKPFQMALQTIHKIAQHQATVLIQGETGTGKENAARAIHYLGNRAHCPFVPLNCATIPDDLLESELFGHEKGAFTDARTKQEGLVALANGGTLFLDEVDSLSPKAQAALLRFLQTHEYRPVGSKHLLRANVRIIAATNADLKHLCSTKQFREDLFFRLNVLNLLMPPLRIRKDDLAIIADNLIHRFSSQYNLPVKSLSHRSLRYLEQQSWPGNVREFENILLRSFLFSSGKYVEVESQDYFEADEYTAEQEIDLEDEALSVEDSGAVKLMSTNTSFQDAKAQAIEMFEKDYLQQVMALTKGNVSLAAKISGKERRALGKLLQKYQIDKLGFQSANLTA